MVTSLFRYERITTTKQKAMEVRRTAEKLITKAKVDSVHTRRHVAKYIYDDAVVARLFEKIVPRMKDRNGGYTRVLKLGKRAGDVADVAILEFVDFSIEDESLNRKKKPVEGLTDDKTKMVEAKNKNVKNSKDVSKSSNKTSDAHEGQVRRFNRVKGS